MKRVNFLVLYDRCCMGSIGFRIGHGTYRIIYELVDDRVHVVTVVHGRRLLPEDIF